MNVERERVRLPPHMKFCEFGHGETNVWPIYDRVMISLQPESFTYACAVEPKEASRRLPLKADG
jgi:hypothetical protein